MRTCRADFACTQDAVETVTIHNGRRHVTDLGRCYYHHKLAEGLITPEDGRRNRRSTR